MPFINVKVLRGTLNPRKKEQIVRRITEAFIAIGGEQLRDATWVSVEELTSHDWAGRPVVLPPPSTAAAGAITPHGAFAAGPS